MYPRVIMIMFSLVLGACGPAISTPRATVSPTRPELTGTVEIQRPEDGTVVYAEAMLLAGTADAIPGNQFTIMLVGADDSTIAQSNVPVNEDGTWQIELVHGYNAEPTEVTILALPTGASIEAGSDYAIKPVVLAGSAFRPEGTFGSITAPFDGSSVGGDLIAVSGTVSGVFENEFSVVLIREDGTILDQKTVLVANAYFIDEVPWSVDLLTSGYTGPATIRAFDLSARDGSEIPIASINVTITPDAG